jgi:hypothetical protein
VGVADEEDALEPVVRLAAPDSIFALRLDGSASFSSGSFSGSGTVTAGRSAPRGRGGKPCSDHADLSVDVALRQVPVADEMGEQNGQDEKHPERDGGAVTGLQVPDGAGERVPRDNTERGESFEDAEEGQPTAPDDEAHAVGSGA